MDKLIQFKDKSGNSLYPRIKTSNVINDGFFLQVSDSGTAGQYLALTPQGPQWQDLQGTEVISRYRYFSEAPDSLVTFKGLNIPVGVETSAGTYYPLQKGSLQIGSDSVTIDITPYLAYQGQSALTGTWRAWFSAGHQTSDSVDLSDYYTSAVVDSLLDGKMDLPGNQGTAGQVLTKTPSGYLWLTPTSPQSSDSAVNLVTVSFTSQSSGIIQWSDSKVTFKGCSAVPVGVKTSYGKYYPVQKGSVGISNQGTWLIVTPYLAYDNASSFTGTWTAYFSSGQRQQTLIQFSQFAHSDAYGHQPSWHSGYYTQSLDHYWRFSADGGQNWTQPVAVQQLSAGIIVPFAGPASAIPYGWLLCDGSSLWKDVYPQLYAAIGTTYGSLGTEGFKLPDLRGAFLRGYQQGTSAQLGVKQGDAIRNITGQQNNILTSYVSSKPDYNDSNSSAIYAGSIGTLTVYNTQSAARQVTAVYMDASRAVPTASQNRPVNYAVNYIIKAF